MASKYMVLPPIGAAMPVYLSPEQDKAQVV